MSTTLLISSEGNFSQKGWHSHPGKKTVLKKKFFHWVAFCSIDCFTLGFWVESLIKIKDFHYQPNNHILSLPSHNHSLGLTPVQWVGRDHHACLSLQKEKHWISLWFSLKSKGENLGRESIRRKEKKKERDRERDMKEYYSKVNV